MDYRIHIAKLQNKTKRSNPKPPDGGVVVKRITPPPKVDQSKADHFQLLEVVVDKPQSHPPKESIFQARPFQFNGNYATRYVMMCPHCGQGFEFATTDMTKRHKRYFISCPNCGRGTPPQLPDFVDPFQNPMDVIEPSNINDELIMALDNLPDTIDLDFGP